MYPSAPATENLVTVAVRCLGSLRLTGLTSWGEAGAGASSAFFLATDSGWPTLQLSR
jgi:hypothetical protein